jgi:hypothetical protein
MLDFVYDIKKNKIDKDSELELVVVGKCSIISVFLSHYEIDKISNVICPILHNLRNRIEEGEGK